MNNPFVRHIAIWYAPRDHEMALKIMDMISDWCIGFKEKEIYSNYERTIYLKDGTWIKAFPANDNMRGQRCTDSFVINPENIKDIIDKVIRPITSLGSGSVSMINTDDERELWQQLVYRRFI